MSSSEGCMNDDSKGFNEDETSADGYGGMVPYIYDAIVNFKKTGEYPDFCDQKENRNAHFHWRCKSKRFTLTDSGVLLYSGHSANPSTARAVVRVGEVRLAIRFIHEKIGHTGAKHTNTICARRLYWRSMHKDIYRYVAECDFCKKKREIKKNDPQLSHITSPPTLVSSSPDEDAEMQMIADRLLLNDDDRLDGVLQEYYREAEQPAVLPVYEAINGGQLCYLVDAVDETEVAHTLSTMNGGPTYLVAMHDPSIKMEPDESHSTPSIVYDEVEEEEEVEERGGEGQNLPMIVTDDLIPAGSNEIVTTMMSPGCMLDKSLPSPSEEEGLRMEEREEDGHLMDGREEDVRIMVERREERAAGGGGMARKRRLSMAPSLAPSLMVTSSPYPMERRGVTTNLTKKRLLEENQALRSRLSLLESIHLQERSSVAMQMPPADEEAVVLQKNLLLMQREVLMLQRTYWQSKLQREGFDMHMGEYYDEISGGGVMEEEERGRIQMHYGEEVEEEELEEHRVIDDGIIGSAQQSQMMEVDTSYCSQRTGLNDSADERELERMAALPEINMHDQEGISYTLSTALCEDFHRFERAQDGTDEIFAESFDLCCKGVKALEETMRSSGRRDPKVNGALKQLRSEVEAYRLVLLAHNYEDQVEQAKDVSVLARACAHDDDVRQLVTLLRWSEQAAAEGGDPSGFADLCREYESFEMVVNVKRDTTNAIQRGNSIDLGADFDSKNSGSDGEMVDKVYRVVFALVRCGKYEEARELLVKTGAASLAPLLSLRRVQEEFAMTPIEKENPYSKMLQKRKLFKKTIAAILNKEGSTLSAPLRMLWAALAGRVEPLLSLANKTEDRIWVLANAAVEAKLDELAGGEIMCDAPGSVESIFGEVLPHESWPYFRLYSALIRADARDAVKHAAEFLADYDKNDKTVPEHLLRFMAHLVIIFRNTKKPHDTILGNRIILKYTGKLLNLSLTHLIPFYVNYLNDATGKLVTMQTMYRMKSVQSRLSFIDALSQAGQNYRQLVKEVVIKSRLDEANSPTDLIDRFRWLLYKERETETDAVIEACVLLRKFLESGDDASVRSLLEMCAARDGSLADRVRARGVPLAPEVRRACAEYTEFVYYLNGTDAYDAWRQAHAERVNEKRKDSTRSDVTGAGSSMLFSAEAALESKRAGERADRLRATESMLSAKGVAVMEMFMRHEGWRTRGGEREEDGGEGGEEQERTRCLRVLRDRYFASSLIRMAQMHAESGEERAALECTTLVHSLALHEDISKEKLRTFLQYIHKVTRSIIN